MERQAARTQSLYVPAARLLEPELKALAMTEETAPNAETAIEIALAAGDLKRAAAWVRQAQNGALDHWLMLIEIAGGRTGEAVDTGLKTTEQLALKGRFAPELLHRLVTVLDALEVDIPIPLWEAASRTPQPTKGHLPETGVLAHLKSAAAEKKFGLAVLLAMRTLGPDGSEGAHIIALGDSIRALKVIGLEADARRLALEALFASWPRQAVR